jgi:choline dehydrogenase-like flavoprotein
VFQRRRYKNAEKWYDGATGRPFGPGVHYYVGGNTKVYGACLPRFRTQDFQEIKHQDGISPAWPVSYADMEPYYGEAERMYQVHGEPGDDPTEPPRTTDYPFPALEHEPPVAALADAMTAQGLHPFRMPAGVDIRAGGACIRTRTCDGFPCPRGAKNDAETRGIRPALQSPTVRLLTRTVVDRLNTSADGRRVTEAVARRDGSPVLIKAGRFVVDGGAVNSAVLLLKSVSDRHPRGLANSSGLVGRNYMVHNSTFFLGVDPRRRNTVSFQKTLGLNDWYLAGPDNPCPLGNLQMLGKIQGPMVKAARRWVPMPLLTYMTNHSIDIYLTTEDLPDPDNRVVVGSDGRITVLA